MTLQQLRDFLAVAEQGSFRQAARILGVSQAGLTSSLKALESSLGGALLVRSGRGVHLTEAGRRLYARAIMIDREARRAEDEVLQLHGHAAGPVDVAIGPSMTALLLPRVVADFRARFPKVELRLTGGFFEQILPSLQLGKIDFAVTSVPDEGAGGGLVSTPLLQTRLNVVARKGHPMAGARSLRELATCEWVVMGPPGRPGGTIVRFFEDNGLPTPRAAVRCESFAQVMALVNSTDLLALVPRVMLDQGLLGNRVVPVELEEQAHSFEICLVRRADVSLTPAAAELAAMCESCSRIIAGMGRQTAGPLPA